MFNDISFQRPFRGTSSSLHRCCCSRCGSPLSSHCLSSFPTLPFKCDRNAPQRSAVRMLLLLYSFLLLLVVVVDRIPIRVDRCCGPSSSHHDHLDDLHCACHQPRSRYQKDGSSPRRCAFGIRFARFAQAATAVENRALKNLFTTTNGGQWLADCITGTQGSSWTTLTESTNACNGGSGSTSSKFYGISCDANGHVIGLDLSSCGLTGTLSGSLTSGLTFLKTLQLSKNGIGGSLPSGWDALSSLKFVDVSKNVLSGPIPPSWPASLEELRLSANQLTGTLPTTWTTSTQSNLRILALDENLLTGSLPAGWGQHLPKLVEVDLTRNQLSGVLPGAWAPSDSFGGLRELQTLKLSNNGLQGTLPTSWSFFSRLTELLLHNNQLNGTLPTSWKALNQLTALHLAMNFLTGSLPNEWTSQLNLLTRIAPCNVTCNGTVAQGAVCIQFGSASCLSLTIWYNCFRRADVPSSTISGAAWFWSLDVGLDPQQTDASCGRGTDRATNTSSHSVSLTATRASLTEEGTMDLSESFTRMPSPSATTGQRPSRSVSSTMRTLTTQQVSLTVSGGDDSSSSSWSVSDSPTATASGGTTTESSSGHRSGASWSWSVTPSSSKYSWSASMTAEIKQTVTTPLPSSVTITLPLPLPPVVGDTPSVAVRDGGSAVSGAAAIGSLLGVDPGGAAVQAVLTFLACRGDEPTYDGTFSSWLATLSISPFMPLGLLWAAVGNVLLLLAVAALHALCAAGLHAARKEAHTPFTVVAEALRFPSLSVMIGEWLLTGVAVCGAALASGTAGSATTPLAVGWFCVVLSATAVTAWYFAAYRCVTESSATNEFSEAQKRSWIRCSCLYVHLRPTSRWQPLSLTRRWGPLYEAMKGGRAWWWRWATVAVLTIVAGVTGAGGVRGGGCTASLAVCCAILCVTGVFLALAHPYALPSENVLNPIKFLLLGSTTGCLLAFEATSSTDGAAQRKKDTALSTLAALQAVITVIRFSIRWWMIVTRDDEPHSVDVDNGHHSSSLEQVTSSVVSIGSPSAAEIPLIRRPMSDDDNDEHDDVGIDESPSTKEDPLASTATDAHHKFNNALTGRGGGCLDDVSAIQFEPMRELLNDDDVFGELEEEQDEEAGSGTWDLAATVRMIALEASGGRQQQQPQQQQRPLLPQEAATATANGRTTKRKSTKKKKTSLCGQGSLLMNVLVEDDEEPAEEEEEDGVDEYQDLMSFVSVTRSELKKAL